MSLTGFINNSEELKQLIKNLKQIDEVNIFKISINAVSEVCLFHKTQFYNSSFYACATGGFVSINWTLGKT